MQHSILDQARRNANDLAAVGARLYRIEAKIDALNRKVDRLDGRFGNLVKKLPATIGESVREAFRERDRRK